MLSFGHSVWNIRIAGLGWVLSSHCCIPHHYTLPLSVTQRRGKMLFRCQVNLDWSHVQPEVINYFYTVLTAKAIQRWSLKWHCSIFTTALIKLF